MLDFFLKPPHCKKCHYTWWYEQFDFVAMTPIESKVCPCCSNSEFKYPYVGKHGPAPGKKNVIEMFCPICQIHFWARKNWPAKQLHLKGESNKDKIMPIVTKTLEQVAKEFASENQETDLDDSNADNESDQ